MNSDDQSIKYSNKFGDYYPPAEDRRCTAMSKQTGERCKRWSKKGFTVCHYHGARGGPKTPQGIENSKNATLKDGDHAFEKIQVRLMDRINKTAAEQAELLRIAPGYIATRLGSMSFKQYRQYRKPLADYCKGNITMKTLIDIIDGKK